MGKYDHNNVPKINRQRQKDFVKFAAANITEWRAGMSSVVSYTGNKFIYWDWREHHKSLSYSWSVCTQKMWREARAELAKSGCSVVPSTI